MHLHVIVEYQQLPHQRVVELACELTGEIFAKQVRPSDCTDKERVAREHARCGSWFVNVDRDMLRRVSRRVEERERDIDKHPALAAPRFVVRVAEGRAWTRDDARAQRAQLAGAAA